MLGQITQMWVGHVGRLGKGGLGLEEIEHPDNSSDNYATSTF